MHIKPTAQAHSSATETLANVGMTDRTIAAILRMEALAELILAVTAYRYLDGGWLPFAALILLPDLSMLGYLVNARIGAIGYNLGHTVLAPAMVALLGFLLALPTLYCLALIWVSHIAFDRVMGYGLKSPNGFASTHLGRIGRLRPGRA